jgi:AcrR family transcriptional regulator
VARVTTVAETPDRLLDAAELLFAERGIDAVSVRAVNAAAGANVAAVHYHFGSKESLVEAVLRRRMDALAQRRRAILDALPRRPTVRAVVEALVVPLAELSATPTSDGRAYVRVLAMLQSGGSEARRRLGRAFAPQFDAFDAALGRALPDLPTPVRHFRLALVASIVIGTLAEPEAAATTLGIDPTDHPAVVDALVDTVTGALAAPFATEPKGHQP